MAAVNVLNFDVAQNAAGFGVVYVVGKDSYLYHAELKPKPEDLVWQRSKNPIPEDLTPYEGWTGVLNAYDNVMRFCSPLSSIGRPTFHISTDMGETWQSYPIVGANGQPVDGSFGFDMYANDDFILLLGSRWLLRSADGRHWQGLVEVADNTSVACSGSFVATGGWGVVSVAAASDMEDPAKWNTYASSGQVSGGEPNLLNSETVKVILDDRYSMMYLIQQDGISYGKVHVAGGKANVAWYPPFQNIQDWGSGPDGTGEVAYFVLGDIILQVVNYDTQAYTVYRLNGAEPDPKRNYVIEADKWTNPYASVGRPKSQDGLRLINPPRGGSYRLLLDNHLDFSMSSDGGQTWSPVTVNSPS